MSSISKLFFLKQSVGKCRDNFPSVPTIFLPTLVSETSRDFPDDLSQTITFFNRSLTPVPLCNFGCMPGSRPETRFLRIFWQDQWDHPGNYSQNSRAVPVNLAVLFKASFFLPVFIIEVLRSPPNESPTELVTNFHLLSFLLGLCCPHGAVE